MQAVSLATGFLVRSLVVLGIFLALWPMVRKPYAALFRSAGNCLVDSSSSGRARFSRLEDGDENHDTRLDVVHLEKGIGNKVSLSSRGHGFLPTAFVVALALATPTSWRTRLRITFWSVTWVHVYILAKLMLLPVANDPPHPAGGTSVVIFGKTILESFFWIVGTSASGWMIVPIIIWASVAMSQTDLVAIVRTRGLTTK